MEQMWLLYPFTNYYFFYLLILILAMYLIITLMNIHFYVLPFSFYFPKSLLDTLTQLFIFLMTL